MTLFFERHFATSMLQQLRELHNRGRSSGFWTDSALADEARVLDSILGSLGSEANEARLFQQNKRVTLTDIQRMVGQATGRLPEPGTVDLLPGEVEEIVQDQPHTSLLLHESSYTKGRGVHVCESPTAYPDGKPLRTEERERVFDHGDSTSPMIEWIRERAHTTTTCFFVEPFLWKFRGQQVTQLVAPSINALIRNDPDFPYDLYVICGFDSGKEVTTDVAERFRENLSLLRRHLGGANLIAAAVLDKNPELKQNGDYSPHDRIILTDFGVLTSESGFDLTVKQGKSLQTRRPPRLHFASVFQNERNYFSTLQEIKHYVMRIRRDVVPPLAQGDWTQLQGLFSTRDSAVQEEDA